LDRHAAKRPADAMTAVADKIEAVVAPGPPFFAVAVR
jgi:hypothetical protein